MFAPAARVGDMHTCPMASPTPHVGGPILSPGTPTVLVAGLPAARVGDLATCAGPPDVIAMGSLGVFVAGKPFARVGDLTAHGGVIVAGCPTVLVGDVGGGAGLGAATICDEGSTSVAPSSTENDRSRPGSTRSVSQSDSRSAESPEIDPREVVGKTPQEIDSLARAKGLISKGPSPSEGRGAYVDPVTGAQRILCHPFARPPHAHVNNPEGERLDVRGNVVAAESPAAHLEITLSV